ncbi:hypothetical protein RhiirA4_482004, partial [Rhizophagus irregularis]
EHQKRLSARYFIEKLCSLIAIRVEALVIKETDFNAVATFQNLDPEEAENLKFDQECSIPDTMALKRFYMRNIYGKDMDDEIWDNLCNKKFINHFSPPEPQKHFYFRKQGYDEESAMKGLEPLEEIPTVNSKVTHDIKAVNRYPENSYENAHRMSL